MGYYIDGWQNMLGIFHKKLSKTHLSRYERNLLAEMLTYKSYGIDYNLSNETLKKTHKISVPTIQQTINSLSTQGIIKVEYKSQKGIKRGKRHIEINDFMYWVRYK